MKRIVCFHFLLLLVGFLQAHDHVLPVGFALEEDIVTGLEEPTDLKIAPDGRIFITEKGGKVRIVENGVLLDQPFHTVATQSPNERGLDGIALDPDFDNNGFVYLFYTLANENRNKVARVTAAGNTAIPSSEVELIRFDAMWSSWHNGGAMVFDDMGRILIGVGDGLTSGPQSIGSTIGKIVRINKDGSIPQDNPFYAQTTGINRSIFAYGMRNPYTMAISRLSGKVFFNDVGSEAFEEVNELIAGKNYGWGEVEGPLGTSAPPDSNYKDPVHVYDHDFGCAVVGATFYEPGISLFPGEYFGKYFFLEFCEGKIMTMDPNSYQVEVFGSGLGPGYNNLEATDDGFIYLINVERGTLSRLSFQGINAPPLISSQPESQAVPVGESVEFSVSASSENLSYAWYRNGALVPDANSNTYALPNAQLSDHQTEVLVHVSNSHGTVISDTASLQVVDGSRPAIQFQNIPSTYAAGDSIFFSAVVSDPDQQIVPPTALSWQIDFHHGAHSHPALGPLTGTYSGGYRVDTFGEVDTNVFFRISLAVEDSTGLVGERSVEVQPELVTLLIESEPEGAGISIDGAKKKTNYALRTVRNLNRIIQASPYAIFGDTLYQFAQWGNGDDSLIQVVSGANDTLQIFYEGLQEYVAGVPSLGTFNIYRDTANQEFFRTEWVSEVSKNWDTWSPYPWDDPPFPDDYFSCSWEGTVLAPVSDWYDFYLFHDGKVSFSLDGEAFLDGKVAVKSQEEDTVRVWLEKGQLVDLKLLYDHQEYLARVELDWSYSIVERHKVPFSRRGSLEELLKDEDGVSIYPNPSDANSVNLYLNQEKIEGTDLKVEVFDAQGRRINKFTGIISGSVFPLPVAGLRPGVYHVVVTHGERKTGVKLVRL